MRRPKAPHRWRRPVLPLPSEVREKPVYLFLAECPAGSDGAVLLRRGWALWPGCRGNIRKTGQEGIKISLGKTGGRRSWPKTGGRRSWPKTGGRRSWLKTGGRRSWPKTGGRRSWPGTGAGRSAFRRFCRPRSPVFCGKTQ
jgi:hypothetical protein